MGFQGMAGVHIKEYGKNEIYPAYFLEFYRSDEGINCLSSNLGEIPPGSIVITDLVFYVAK